MVLYLDTQQSWNPMLLDVQPANVQHIGIRAHDSSLSSTSLPTVLFHDPMLHITVGSISYDTSTLTPCTGSVIFYSSFDYKHGVSHVVVDTVQRILYGHIYCYLDLRRIY